MTIIDSHQHFWDLEKFDYSWMPSGESVLKKNHLPADLKPLMDDAGVEKTVIVQAVQSIEEARWLWTLPTKTTSLPAWWRGSICSRRTLGAISMSCRRGPGSGASGTSGMTSRTTIG